MAIDVASKLKSLRGMTIPVLRERYAEVFGEPTRSNNKQFLVKRIIWRMQALDEGGLSERARRRAAELARDADLRIRPPTKPVDDDAPTVITEAPFRVAADDRLPMPGTLLTREYKGQTIQVRVLHKGFEFDGEIYRSLSAVAGKVTGSHWNGYLFFGITKPTKETKTA
ncbi:MAG TPA: DUF2924 domain-containing protein [Phycisphaerae bacterium]|nr:DUF2924 domain-containing protein [Phycisphaerae bacterium]